MDSPTFWSLAFADIRDPDFTHVAMGVLPAHATADPAAWARSMISLDALPRWLAVPIWLRRVAPSLVGRRANLSRFHVDRVEGDEALIAWNGKRLDMRVGVGIDESRALVRVVITIRVKGATIWSLPLRSVMPFVIPTMIARCRRDLSGVTRCG